MIDTTINLPVAETARTFSQTVLSILLGALFTSALFYSIAHFDQTRTPPPMIEEDDLRAVMAPLEPPPPPPLTPQEEVSPTTMTGFDPGPSESVVKITVTPPDLETILPPPPAAPPAVIQVGQLYTEFKPKLKLSELENRIYQVSEVDQPPMVLDHVIPVLPRSMHQNLATLRATFVVVIDADGSVKTIRLSKTSGNREFDDIMTHNIPEWTFSPAVRKGKKVRCLIEQAVHFKLGGGSPFTL